MYVCAWVYVYVCSSTTFHRSRIQELWYGGGDDGGGGTPVVVNCFVKNHLQCSDILSFYNRAFLFYPQFPFIKKSFVINKRFFTSLCFCYFFYILYIHTYVGTFSFVLNTICKLSLQLLQKKLLYKYEKIKKWLIDMQLFILSSSRSLSRFN